MRNKGWIILRNSLHHVVKMNTIASFMWNGSFWQVWHTILTDLEKVSDDFLIAVQEKKSQAVSSRSSSWAVWIACPHSQMWPCALLHEIKQEILDREWKIKVLKLISTPILLVGKSNTFKFLGEFQPHLCTMNDESVWWDQGWYEFPVHESWVSPLNSTRFRT